MTLRNIEGLTDHGYTAQTFALAHALRQSSEAREHLITLLEQIASPVQYSNQGFDLEQDLAAFFANTIRNSA